MKTAYLKGAEGFLELGKGELGILDSDAKEIIVSNYELKHKFIKIKINDIVAHLDGGSKIKVCFWFDLDDLIVKDEDPSSLKQLEAEVFGG